MGTWAKSLIILQAAKYSLKNEPLPFKRGNTFCENNYNLLTSENESKHQKEEIVVQLQHSLYESVHKSKNVKACKIFGISDKSKIKILKTPAKFSVIFAQFLLGFINLSFLINCYDHHISYNSRSEDAGLWNLYTIRQM